MADVIELDMVTSHDIPAERVLRNAPDDLSGVVLVGETADGGEFFASSYAGAPETIFHLERAKHRLMKIIDEMTDG